MKFSLLCFAAVSWFFPQLGIALQGFRGSEMLSGMCICVSVPRVIKVPCHLKRYQARSLQRWCWCWWRGGVISAMSSVRKIAGVWRLPHVPISELVCSDIVWDAKVNEKEMTITHLHRAHAARLDSRPVSALHFNISAASLPFKSHSSLFAKHVQS